MNDEDKFMRMFGGIFFSVGVLMLICAVPLLLFGWSFFAGGICLLMAVVFGGVGGGILLNQIKNSKKQRNIAKNGKRFSGKIYGYIEDKSCTMNGDYLVNIKVRFFDEEDIEREAILKTKFTKGSSDYPMAATIDIIKLGSEYTWVPGSVRFEHIPREDELLDDLPLTPDKISMVAISCQGCGVSFTAAKGYATKCPYCGNAINA